LTPEKVVGFVEFDAQTVYKSGAAEGQAGFESVQSFSSNVMKSAAFRVVNKALRKIWGISPFRYALPTETSLQS
jgi:hypothetical protein